jgi:hypothetical protein
MATNTGPRFCCILAHSADGAAIAIADDIDRREGNERHDLPSDATDNLEREPVQETEGSGSS